MAVIDLTQEEIRGLMVQAGLVATAADAALVLAALTALEEDALLAALGGAIAGGASPEAVATARALAERQTRRIFGDLAKSELNKIGRIVSDGLAEGIGPRDIARRLTPVRGLDPARASRLAKLQRMLEASDRTDAEVARMMESAFNSLLRDRRQAIARTEARFATSAANQEIAESRGQQHKIWITTGDDRVDDACQGNEAQGWIGIKETFQSGSDTPPDHPLCRCSLAYRTAPPTDAAKARADAAAAQTAAAKEAAAKAEREAKAAAKAAA